MQTSLLGSASPMLTLYIVHDQPLVRMCSADGGSGIEHVGNDTLSSRASFLFSLVRSKPDPKFLRSFYVRMSPLQSFVFWFSGPGTNSIRDTRLKLFIMSRVGLRKGMFFYFISSTLELWPTIMVWPNLGCSESRSRNTCTGPWRSIALSAFVSDIWNESFFLPCLVTRLVKSKYIFSFQRENRKAKWKLIWYGNKFTS